MDGMDKMKNRAAAGIALGIVSFHFQRKVDHGDAGSTLKLGRHRTVHLA
jgi:hypothetical protein